MANVIRQWSSKEKMSTHFNQVDTQTETSVREMGFIEHPHLSKE